MKLKLTGLGIIISVSFLMHFPHFSKELISFHTWRQTETQSCINNFYEEDMNILNPRRNNRGNKDGISRREFPLMQWLVALEYKILGKSILLTRLTMFLIGIFTTIGFYKLFSAIFKNDWVALLGAWAFTFSPSFFYFTICPIPDNLALCLSVWGLAFFYDLERTRSYKKAILGGFLLGVGALCKLPFILFFIVPLIGLEIERRNKKLFDRKAKMLFYSLLFGFLPVAWYAWVIPQWGDAEIITGITSGSTPLAVSLEYLTNTLFSLFPEIILNYGSLPLFLAGVYFFIKKKAFQNPLFPSILGLSILVSLYYLFEINAIAKHHDYYLFPFYPILFLLVAYGLKNMILSDSKALKNFAFFCLAILPLTCFLRLQNRWDLNAPGNFNKDLLIYKNELRAATPKNDLVIAGNDESFYIFFYYIDKKGWAFQNDNLTEVGIKNRIKDGAKYLYTDSENIIENPDLNQFFDEKILEKGSIQVFSLTLLNETIPTDK